MGRLPCLTSLLLANLAAAVASFLLSVWILTVKYQASSVEDLIDVLRSRRVNLALSDDDDGARDKAGQLGAVATALAVLAILFGIYLVKHALDFFLLIVGTGDRLAACPILRAYRRRLDPELYAEAREKDKECDSEEADSYLVPLCNASQPGRPELDILPTPIENIPGCQLTVNPPHFHSPPPRTKADASGIEGGKMKAENNSQIGSKQSQMEAENKCQMCLEESRSDRAFSGKNCPECL